MMKRKRKKVSLQAGDPARRAAFQRARASSPASRFFNVSRSTFERNSQDRKKDLTGRRKKSIVLKYQDFLKKGFMRKALIPALAQRSQGSSQQDRRRDQPFPVKDV
jgi:hypothetical protein